VKIVAFPVKAYLREGRLEPKKPAEPAASTGARADVIELSSHHQTGQITVQDAAETLDRVTADLPALDARQLGRLHALSGDRAIDLLIQT